LDQLARFDALVSSFPAVQRDSLEGGPVSLFGPARAFRRVGVFVSSRPEGFSGRRAGLFFQASLRVSTRWFTQSQRGFSGWWAGFC